MIEWGISGNSHDAALAVFENKQLVFASHSERFSRIKNDPHLNDGIINYALNWGEPEKVYWYETPWLKTARQLYAGQGFVGNNIKKYLKKFGIKAPIQYRRHHYSHAAAGYYTSSFYNAAVLVIDGIGEWDTTSIWKGEGDTLEKVWSQKYPKSLGLFYTAMTQRIGLKPNEEEYILMAQAALGAPHHVDSMKPLLKRNLHTGADDFLFNEGDWDIAASTQQLYEEEFRKLLKETLKQTGQRNLVLAGGCALNCKANSIAYEYFDKVWIMPSPGDAGSAIGAGLDKHIEWTGPFLGYNILTTHNLVQPVIDSLLKDKMAGVATGAAEFGPRALGNRSLLADPRIDRDDVNDVKQREHYRPFAPMILKRFFKDYFMGPQNPYMQFICEAKRNCQYNSIMHEDRTSRVQVVDDGYELLEAWYEKTGIPMLLNTSLNIKGEPIVNTEDDAKRFEKKYGVKVFS